MSEILVTGVRNAGDDILVVEGYVDGDLVTAYGWISALTNHYDDTRAEDAKPRQMTSGEARGYCEQLLVDELGKSTPPAAAGSALPVSISLDPEPVDPNA
jgi:hypothetical protein